MNKKEARRRKHQKQKLITRQNILESEIIGENEGEEKETLLGNLARVKQIPMITWESIPTMPLFYKTLHFPYEEGEDWFDKLFTEVSKNEDCDLIGFTPVKNLSETDFAEIGIGSVGMGVQIEEVEKTVTNSLIIKMRGICRYETTGFLPSPDEYFNIKVRWFEDIEEPKEVWLSPYQQYLRNIEDISKVAGGKMKEFFNVSTTTAINYHSAHYGSMLLLNMFENWFSIEEQIELIKLTSTSQRLKRVNERVAKILPFIQKRGKILDIGRNN